MFAKVCDVLLPYCLPSEVFPYTVYETSKTFLPLNLSLPDYLKSMFFWIPFWLLMLYRLVQISRSVHPTEVFFQLCLPFVFSLTSRKNVLEFHNFPPFQCIFPTSFCKIFILFKCAFISASSAFLKSFLILHWSAEFDWKNLKASYLISGHDVFLRSFSILQVSLYPSTASPIVVGPGLLSKPC